MTTLLTCDTAIADVVIPVTSGNSAMMQHWQTLHRELWGKQGTTKVTIDLSKRNDLLATLAEIHGLDHAVIAQVKAGDRPALHALLNQLTDRGVMSIQPGGTALNIVQPLAKAFQPEQLKVTLLTSLGTGPVGEALRSSLGLNQQPPVIRMEPAASDTARTAMSLVYLQHDPANPSKTKRDIAKFDGNFKTEITPENTNAALSEKPDAILLLGTLLQKNAPMFHALLDKSLRENTDLYFAMPTAKNITQENRDTIKRCLNRANVVLSNDEEIGYLFEGNQTASPAEMEAYLPIFAKELAPGCRAFITRGARGAWILEKGQGDDYTLGAVPLWSQTANIAPPRAQNTLGAGDKAFAGFLMGHIAGHSAMQSAHLGMAMAHQRLTQDSQQIEEPAQVYQEAVRALGIADHNQDPRLMIQKSHALGAPAAEVSHAK